MDEITKTMKSISATLRNKAALLNDLYDSAEIDQDEADALDNAAEQLRDIVYSLDEVLDGIETRLRVNGDEQHG